MKRYWAKEIAFGIYLCAALICIFGAIYFESIISAIIAIVLAIGAYTIKTEHDDNPKIIYEIITIKDRTDIVAVKQIVIPLMDIKFPETIKKNGMIFTFSHMTDSPLLDGAYYKIKTDENEKC